MIGKAQADEPAVPSAGRSSPIDHEANLVAWFLDRAVKACADRDHRAAMDRLLWELCQRLVERGVSLDRVVIGVRALHPQLFGRQTIWQRGCDCVTTVERESGIENSPTYLQSPVRHIREFGQPLRRRLIGPGARLDFPILEELEAAGATDYVIHPLRRGDERAGYVSLTTDAPPGFDPDALTLIESVVPALTLVVELFSAKRMTDDLLAVYLGRDAAHRVLDGEIHRGTGQLIRAALWHCDINGFTTLSDVTPAAELIVLLDAYFEAMARPVEDRGGEVLKFIGDGLLAIFRDDPENPSSPVTRALDAAIAALANLERLNAERGTEGRAPLVTKIALHVGEVMYGNVGAADRLDFTVIGPAVNTVARVQALCGELDEPVLATRDFAELAQAQMVSRGAHRLRGQTEPAELFALKGRASQEKGQVKP